MRRALIITWVVSAVGCDCDTSLVPITDEDAGVDAGRDSGVFVPDAGRDAGQEAGVDAGYDAGIDAGPVDSGVMPYDAGPEDPNDSGCPDRMRTGTRSVTYQINVAHTGEQPNDQLTLPLCRRWSHDFGLTPGYPVVAEGKVFVTTKAAGSNYGTQIWALNQYTGDVVWGPADAGGTYWVGGLAYDDGRVFTINFNGALRALDSRTGAELWSMRAPNGQYAVSSPPTAVNGRVYCSAAGVGGDVYSVNAADGGLKWTRPVANGDHSSPAVTAAGVFVSYACNQAWGYDLDGGLLWHHTSTCSGGGGKTVAVYGGRVYTRDFDGNLMLDMLTGVEVGRYASQYIPAFSGGTMFTTASQRLNAASPIDGGVRWTFAGSSSVYTAPIVVGPHVIVADGTNVYVVDTADGGLASSFPIVSVLGPDEQNVSAPFAGFAAADGMLFVPAGTAIVAF